MCILGMLGAALFYGDCLLTPAISVLSAVEGLNVATPAFEPVILPIAMVVLIGLFAMQHFGTGGIGHLFGPIMLIWFAILFVLGVRQIVQQPEVLMALSPQHAFAFAMKHKTGAFVALGAVTLALTGAEALYADIGHFGRNPIRAAWLIVVFPALLANYYGQGALLLADPTAASNPFFKLAPRLGALSPGRGRHDGDGDRLAGDDLGRLLDGPAGDAAGAEPARAHPAYLAQRVRPDLRAGRELAAARRRAGHRAGLQDRPDIASAYGIAVTGTMLITTMLVLTLAVRSWKWPWLLVVPLFLLLLVVDGSLFSANMMKFVEGGWVPLVIATVLFIGMWTWYRGRQAVSQTRARAGRADRHAARHHRPGDAQSPAGHGDLSHDLLRQRLQQPDTEPAPQWRAASACRAADRPPPGRTLRLAGGALRVRELGSGLHRAVLCYGFMEKPDAGHDVAGLGASASPSIPCTRRFSSATTTS